jgi:hypothetical protein
MGPGGVNTRIAIFALALLLAATGPADAGSADATSDRISVAQAMIPPTGMASEDKAMAAENMPAAERMRRRFPQPAKVGSLIRLPVIDENARTLGYVREVVRTRQGAVKLIVSSGGWFGWGARFEVLGIACRQLVSLDMPRSDYATASTWQRGDEQVIPNDDNISVALARR